MPSKFQKWYSNPKNRARLNKRRLHKYKTDPVYRASVLKNTKRWRELHKGDKTEPKLPKIFYTIGEVASTLEVEQKTLRTLEKANLIPRTSQRGHHRRFNKNQIGLISAIVKHRKSVHYTNSNYQSTLAKLSKAAFAKWGQ